MNSLNSDLDEAEIVFDKLKPLLNERGFIKSLNEVNEIVKLMESYRSISSRCVLISALGATANASLMINSTKEVLKRFLVDGGWMQLSQWFNEALQLKHFSFLTFLIETMYNFPITVDLLKQGCIARSLKNVSKLDSKALQLASRKLLVHWKKYVKEISDSKKPSSTLPSNKSNEKITQTNSFLDSLSAAMSSNENVRKRKITSVNTNADDDAGTLGDGGEPANNQSDDHLVNSTTKPNPVFNLVAEKPFDDAANTSFSEANIVNAPIGDKNDENVYEKKRVRFKDNDLVQIFYFEMTEQERSDMHGPPIPLNHIEFSEARHLELLNEKKALQTVKTLSEEKEGKVQWVRCVIIDDVIEELQKGCNSKEKQVQFARESNILAILYMDKTKIPDSPSEPLPQDCVIKTDAELNLTIEHFQFNTKCIPYWENYDIPYQIPRKPFFPTPMNEVRRGGMLPPFRGRARLNQYSANFTRPPQPPPPIRGQFTRPRPPMKMRGDFMPYQEMNNQVIDEKYGNNSAAWYGANNSSMTKMRPQHNIGTPMSNFDDVPNGACRHFMKGKCKLGASCRFRHDSNVNNED